jgi:CO/xanthine dehydrogenase Mo-binding subunit
VQAAAVNLATESARITLAGPGDVETVARLKRAVRWTAMRTESFLADEHARDVAMDVELGLDAQGKFTALRVSTRATRSAGSKGFDRKSCAPA